MASTNQIITDYLIREKGVVETINKMTNLKDQTKAVIGMIDILSAKTGKSFVETSQALEKIQARAAQQNAAFQAGAVPAPSATPLFDDKAKEALTQASIASTAAHKRALEEQAERTAAARAAAAEARANVAKLREEEAKNHQEKMKQISEEQMAKLQEQALIENGMRDYAAKIKAVGKMVPGDQAQGIAELALEMEKATNIRFDTWIKNIGKEVGASDAAMSQAAKRANEMKLSFWGMAKQLLDVKNIMNVAFGVFTAMGIFQVTQLLSQIPIILGQIVDQANKVTKAFQELAIAETTLSASSVEVSGKQMLDTLTAWETKYTNISKTDLAGNLAQATTELATSGLTYEQIVKVAEMSMQQAIKSGKTFNDTFSAIRNYLLTGEKQGAGRIGLGFDEKVVKLKAQELGLVTNTSDKLSEMAERQAVFALLVEKTSKEEQQVLASQNDLVYASDRLQRIWTNLTGKGSKLAENWNFLLWIIGSIILGWQTIGELLDGTKQPTTALQKFIVGIVKPIRDVSQAMYDWLTPMGLIGQGLGWIFNKLKALYELASGRKIADQPGPSQLAKQNEPTGKKPLSGMADSVDKDTKNIKDNITDLIEWLEKLKDKAKEMQAEFDRETINLNYDFNLDQQRDYQDFLHDLAQLTDDTNDKIAKANADYRDKEKEAEARFQEELRKLREKFLMSLEDALRERDARQVLRLLKEYQMNKQNLINDYALDKAARARAHAASLKQMQDERKDREAELRYEYELRRQRELEDFNEKMRRRDEEHAIEMAKLQEDIKDKLREVANAMAEELGLDADGAQRIYDTLSQFYGTGGSINKLFDYTYDYLLSKSQATYDAIMKYQADMKAASDAINKVDVTQNPNYYVPGGTPAPITNNPNYYVPGGTQPNESNVLGGLSRRGGRTSYGAGFERSTARGAVTVNVLMSPELRGEIVNDSMEQVAAVLEHVRRS